MAVLPETTMQLPFPQAKGSMTSKLMNFLGCMEHGKKTRLQKVEDANSVWAEIVDLFFIHRAIIIWTGFVLH